MLHKKYICCLCWCKGTNFFANHNSLSAALLRVSVVYAGAKVLIFSQITTIINHYQKVACCLCWCKGTNFFANHNTYFKMVVRDKVVYAGAKVLIFSQITTRPRWTRFASCCLCWCKGTNFFANHNLSCTTKVFIFVVYAGAKVLIFSQITTRLPIVYPGSRCLCWCKGTNFFANHNSKMLWYGNPECCLCWCKGTNFFANHNFCYVVKK